MGSGAYVPVPGDWSRWRADGASGRKSESSAKWTRDATSR